MRKRLLLSIPATALVVGLYTGIVLLLVRVTELIAGISGPALRVVAYITDAALGASLLLGATVIVTRLAVLLFAPSTGLPG